MAGLGWAGHGVGRWQEGLGHRPESGVTCREILSWPKVSSLGVGASSGCGASSPAPPLAAPGVLFHVAAF